MRLRALAEAGLNVWWARTEELDEATLDDSGPGGCPELAEPVALSSCDFTEQDRNDVEAPTRCAICYAPGGERRDPRAKQEL